MAWNQKASVMLLIRLGCVDLRVPIHPPSGADKARPDRSVRSVVGIVRRQSCGNWKTHRTHRRLISNRLKIILMRRRRRRWRLRRPEGLLHYPLLNPTSHVMIITRRPRHHLFPFQIRGRNLHSRRRRQFLKFWRKRRRILILARHLIVWAVRDDRRRICCNLLLIHRIERRRRLRRRRFRDAVARRTAGHSIQFVQNHSSLFFVFARKIMFLRKNLAIIRVEIETVTVQ